MVRRIDHPGTTQKSSGPSPEPKNSLRAISKNTAAVAEPLLRGKPTTTSIAKNSYQGHTFQRVRGSSETTQLVKNHLKGS